MGKRNGHNGSLLPTKGDGGAIKKGGLGPLKRGVKNFYQATTL